MVLTGPDHKLENLNSANTSIIKLVLKAKVELYWQTNDIFTWWAVKLFDQYMKILFYRVLEVTKITADRAIL